MEGVRVVYAGNSELENKKRPGVTERTWQRVCDIKMGLS